MRSSAAGVETVAKAAGHHGGSRAPASRPRRGRPRQILAAGVEAREAGHRGVSRPPASRPWRGRLATSAISRPPASRPRRGRPRQILAAGVETVAREAGQKCGPRSQASRPWRATAGCGARRDRCEGSGMKISWTPKQGDQVRIISDALYYVNGSHIGNLKRAACIDWIA